MFYSPLSSGGTSEKVKHHRTQREKALPGDASSPQSQSVPDRRRVNILDRRARIPLGGCGAVCVNKTRPSSVSPLRVPVEGDFPPSLKRNFLLFLNIQLFTPFN